MCCGESSNGRRRGSSQAAVAVLGLRCREKLLPGLPRRSQRGHLRTGVSSLTRLLERRQRVPALISQVYLHYDPYTQGRRRSTPGRCRGSAWTFLMLLPQDPRIVIEIDGKHHYADDAGQAPAPAVPQAVWASCRQVARPCASQAGAVRAAACVLVNAAVAGRPGAGAARSQVRGRWCPGRS